MSQSDKIIKHLKKKSITAIQALNLYGCFRLAARVKDLRNLGYKIRTDIVTDNAKRFARYSLK